MNGERGYTVVELIVAAGVMLGVFAAVTALLHDGLLHTPVLEEATDVQQRARVAADTVAAELRAVAGGTESGSLMTHFAAIVPRRASAAPGVASASAVTVRYAVPGGARTRLAASFSPADAMLLLDSTGACVQNAVACGFTMGATAAIFDGSGQADVVAVDAIGPGTLTVSDLFDPRVAAYAAGSEVVEISEVSYLLDAAGRQLRREQNGSGFPMVENVTDLRLEYFGTPYPPSEPRPEAGTANCLYAADGTPLMPVVSAAADAVVPLALSALVDGPFCGVGRLMFDADLLRVRGVRATIRLETPVAALRGTNSTLFARPGTAATFRVIPDLSVSIDVALRNPGR